VKCPKGSRKLYSILPKYWNISKFCKKMQRVFLLVLNSKTLIIIIKFIKKKVIDKSCGNNKRHQLKKDTQYKNILVLVHQNIVDKLVIDW